MLSLADGHISFDEFCTLMSRQTAPVDQSYLQAFRQFDKNGDGVLSAQELKTVMASLGSPLTDTDIEAMIRLADANGDGRVDYEEFVRMVKNL